MAERTLALTNCALNLILTDSTENNLLALVSKLRLGHVAEVFLFFDGRKSTSTWGNQFPYPERAAAMKNMNPPIFSKALIFVK